MAESSHSSVSMSVPVFNGDNYDFWSIKMKTFFQSQDLWEIVQDGCGTSKDEKKKGSKALFFLQQALADEMFPRIMGATSAKEAWDILKEEFHGSEKALVAQPLTSLSSESSHSQGLHSPRSFDRSSSTLLQIVRSSLLQLIRSASTRVEDKASKMEIDHNVDSMEGSSDSGPETLENSSSIGKEKVSKKGIRVGGRKAEMLILDELPFRFVENRGFRRFCFELCPLFDLPSRRTIVRELYKLYIDEKIKLKNYFSRSKKRILSFSQIVDHTGDSIGKCIENVLIKWGIDKVFTITVDNATANTTAIGYVIRKLNSWQDGGAVLEGKYLHVRCCAHILNLIVSDGLKDLHDSIVAIRNAVKFVKSSPSRLDRFKKAVANEKIGTKGLVVLDVPTRWNSTYLMLESALKLRKAFQRMGEEDIQYVNYFKDKEDGHKRIGPPTLDDWDNAKVFINFLATFYDITLDFSASLRVTSNIYFKSWCTIRNQLNSLTSERDPLVSKIAVIVLDPRYKLGYVKFRFDSIYGVEESQSMISKVKGVLLDLYEWYNKFYGSSGGGAKETDDVFSIGVSDDLELGRLKATDKEDSLWGMKQQEEDISKGKNEDGVLFYACQAASEEKNDKWYIASGCSNHMTGDASIFCDIDASNKSQVRLGNGALVEVKGKGTIAVETNKGRRFIKNVLLVPNLQQNLLSVGQMIQNGYSLHFEGDSYTIYDNNNKSTVIARVKMENQNFPIRWSYATEATMKAQLDDSWLWHRWFGHFNFQGLKILHQKKMMKDLPFIRDKDDFCEDEGVEHQLTVGYAPEQNGVSERKNQTVMEMARAMLKEKGLPNTFWAEAVYTAVYLLNKCPTKAVQNKTPVEAWSGRKPFAKHLRVFGSICYVHIPKEKRSKLDDKTEKGIFVGYSS
ncbi:hypothetical protein EZV62_010364 [Acer yangbiense]|uniref:Integrase catalytic domain-containing protein n=1 Tax=Acer yangbiense TaxID=1000413 RepID=A0A5C7I2H6_9ROSI|nr:hypothetical protein EZV62_010364 [Acer yangbiense]